METLTNLLLLFAGVILGAAAIGVIAILGTYYWQRTKHANATGTKSGADKSGAKSSITEKFKKAVTLRPSWLVTCIAVAGGWLFLLFSTYVLLPSVWQWFLAHPEFFWMPPLAIFVAQVLYASKKEPAKYLAHAIIFVLFIAVAYALPWWWRSSSENASSMRSTAEQTRISATARWQDCIEIPYLVKGRAPNMNTVTLQAPASAESPCHLIRDGYWFRITPKTQGSTVRLVWQNGRVLDLRETGSTVTPLGNSIRDAAFVMTSLGEKPSTVVVRLVKR